MSWLNGLNEGVRERVFKSMRGLDEKSEKLRQKSRELSPLSGQIAIGAAHADVALRAYAIQEYLGDLRRGASPEEAFTTAQGKLRDAVNRHNALRPRETTWQRWIGFGQDTLMSAHRVIVEVSNG